jgi:mannose/cellobiose epimerase-like protein (N-acyl-D-glucosamine 2-epimerase family)
MGRRPDLSEEMVDAAREVAKKTRVADELRQVMSVVLSRVIGMTLLRVGELIGRSWASAARFQSEFRSWFCGRQDKERKCAGRRRAYLTFEEEN